jgi:hypothetical protein
MSYQQTTKLRILLNWFLQILLITSIALVLILINHNHLHIIIIIIPIIIYIFYTFNSLRSPIFLFLYNKHKVNTIHDYMNLLYTTPPQLLFEIRCFHYGSDKFFKVGNKNIYKGKKKITFSDREPFYYYSWRDISGEFLLQTNDFITKYSQKAYIKLNLDLDVIYAEDGTCADYNIQKNAFYGRNKGRDQNMDMKETIDLQGFKPYNMVRVSDKNTPFINKYVYMLFTFVFPIVELFKLYINHFCEEQTYTIRKVISTRNDLNTPYYIQKYETQIPKINVYGEEVLYKQVTSLVHDSPYIPSQDDLSFSRENSIEQDHVNNLGSTQYYNQPFSNYNPMDVKLNKDAETKLI